MRKYLSKRFFIILLIMGLMVICNQNVWAAQGGARPVSMGGAFVALADDANASTWNPAGLAWQKDQEFSASATINARNDYITGDFISDDYIVYTKQLGQTDSKSGSVGVYYQNSTYENEITRSKTILMQPGIAYGRQFFSSENMAWGVSLNYFNFKSEIPGISSSDTAISLNAGFLWYMSEKMALGLLVENINEPTFTIHGVNSRLIRVWRPGLAYYMNESTVLTCDIYDLTGNTQDRGSDYSQNVRLGMEHYFNDDFSLRLGAHNPNSSMDSSKYYSLGLGWQYAEFFVTHPVCYYFDYTFVYWQDPAVGNEDYLHQFGISCKF
ncbi:MAG: hypothetical protein KKD05_11475 [Candidatus Omnitrophica bacterium]|nr:hypothetical protein [Candidatus Omnitrophota bacterium]